MRTTSIDRGNGNIPTAEKRRRNALVSLLRLQKNKESSINLFHLLLYVELETNDLRGIRYSMIFSTYFACKYFYKQTASTQKYALSITI